MTAGGLRSAGNQQHKNQMKLYRKEGEEREREEIGGKQTEKRKRDQDRRHKIGNEDRKNRAVERALVLSLSAFLVMQERQRETEKAREKARCAERRERESRRHT